MKSDIAWSLLLGIVVAVGPHTSATRLIPSIAGGILVAICVFLLRRRRDAMREAAIPRTTLDVSIPGGVCIAICVALFAPTLGWLYEEYTVSVWRNGHGLFLPIIVYVLARYELDRAPATAVSNSAWGLLLLAVGAAFAFIESVTNLGFAGAAGLVLAVPGMSLLLFGKDVTRRIAFPLALVVFLIPVPEELVDPLHLPSVSAILAEPMLRALDVPVLRDQTSLVLPVSSFGVSANCSGLSSFYSGVLVALVLGRFATSWPKRAALLAAVWPVTVIVNAFRVTFLVGSSNAIGFGWFESPVHGVSGILSFWITIGLLCAIGMREMRRAISA